MLGIKLFGKKEKTEDSLEGGEEPPSSIEDDYEERTVSESIYITFGKNTYFETEGSKRSVSIVEEDDDDIKFTSTYSGDMFVISSGLGKPVYESLSEYKID